MIDADRGAAFHSADDGMARLRFNATVVQLAMLAIALGSAIVGLVAAATGAGWPSASLCLGGGAALALLVLPTLYRRDYDVFEPVTFVSLAVLVGVTLKGPYLVFVSGRFVDDYVLLGAPVADLAAVMPHVLVGIAAFTAGYSLALPALRLDHLRIFRSDRWVRRRLLLLGAFFVAVSLLAGFLFYRRMGLVVQQLSDLSSKRFLDVGATYRTALGYYQWGMSLVEPVFYMLLVWNALHPAPWRSWQRLLLVVSGFLAIVFPIVNSSRTGAATVVLASLIILHFARGGLRPTRVALVGAIALPLFMVVTALRPGTMRAPDLANVANASAFADELVGSRHFLDLAKTAHIIHAIPERVGYQHGETFFRWAVAPIPRSWWSEKPALGSGPVLGPAIFGLRVAGVPPGFIAELYMNFGFIGIPAGMLVFGAFLRWLWATYTPVRRRPAAIVLYAMAVIPLSFALISMDFSKVVVATLIALIPGVVAIAWVTDSAPAAEP